MLGFTCSGCTCLSLDNVVEAELKKNMLNVSLCVPPQFISLVCDVYSVRSMGHDQRNPNPNATPVQMTLDLQRTHHPPAI